MDLVTASGRRVAPLALAAHPETPGAAVDVALDAGVNGFFFYDRDNAHFLEGLARALPSRREHLFVMTGTEARDPRGARADLDTALRRLGSAWLDAFLVLYVSPSDERADVDALLDEMRAWRRRGLVRHLGASAHDRTLATRLASDPRTDVLMHRYNMAHRGAEERVLPAALAAEVPVVAFTCTRWGTLFEGHPAWDAPVPSAVDCYRFALAHPAVRLVLSAPHSVAEARSDVALLAAPTPTPAEMAAWRCYGDLVHGDGRSEFETSWP